MARPNSTPTASARVKPLLLLNTSIGIDKAVRFRFSIQVLTGSADKPVCTANVSIVRKACSGRVDPSTITGSGRAITKISRPAGSRHHSRQIVAASEITCSSRCRWASVGLSGSQGSTIRAKLAGILSSNSPHEQLISPGRGSPVNPAWTVAGPIISQAVEISCVKTAMPNARRNRPSPRTDCQSQTFKCSR